MAHEQLDRLLRWPAVGDRLSVTGILHVGADQRLNWLMWLKRALPSCDVRREFGEAVRYFCGGDAIKRSPTVSTAPLYSDFAPPNFADPAGGDLFEDLSRAWDEFLTEFRLYRPHEADVTRLVSSIRRDDPACTHICLVLPLLQDEVAHIALPSHAQVLRLECVR